MSGSSTYYQDIAAQDAAEFGVPTQLFIDQINQESSFNPNPSTGVPNGGIAQFIPSTAAEYGLNNPASDPTGSLYAAAEYDADLYNQTGSWATTLQDYGTTANGDAPALAAEAADYDAGTTSVSSTSSGGNSNSDNNSTGILSSINNLLQNADGYVIDAIAVVVGVVLIAGSLYMFSNGQKITIQSSKG